MLKAIHYCHKIVGIIHKDIKPANILFTKEKDVLKLADFGISVTFDPEKRKKAKASDCDGTIRYFAPEIYDYNLSFKADIWAFACVLLELATGKFPYFTKTDMQVLW